MASRARWPGVLPKQELLDVKTGSYSPQRVAQAGSNGLVRSPGRGVPV